MCIRIRVPELSEDAPQEIAEAVVGETEEDDAVTAMPTESSLALGQEEHDESLKRQHEKKKRSSSTKPDTIIL